MDKPPPRPNSPLREGFGSALNRIPIRSRLSLTAGVAIGLFAAIITETANETLSRALLVTGIALGVLLAIYFWVRAAR
jgi:Mn2+/Fe2+ NRAMP family transporter